MQSQELTGIIEDLKKDIEQAMAPQSSEGSYTGPAPPAPVIIATSEVQEKPELADDLSAFEAQTLLKPEDSETTEKWRRQAERIVRQYCRLVLVGKTEGGITEDVKSVCQFQS